MKLKGTRAHILGPETQNFKAMINTSPLRVNVSKIFDSFGK